MFKNLLSKIIGKTEIPAQSSVKLLPLAVEKPTYVVGDLHGCYNHMSRMIDKIQSHLQALSDHESAQVVFLGDYVDRGEDSAAVLAKLMELDQENAVTCLIGNHEKMMLEFLDQPAKRGRRWLRYGGLQTLASFGVRGVHERMEGADLEDVANQFRSALPNGLDLWLRGLPLIYQTGNLLCVHASVDPMAEIADQSKSALLWGHPDFVTTAHPSGLTIAHGHTIVDEAAWIGHRIQLDTGCYATGKLSAAFVLGDDVEILQV